MGEHSTSGMGQVRYVNEQQVRVEGEMGYRQFAMRIPEGSQFYEQLETIIKGWEGRWSMAAVIRKLVAEAAGAEFLEEAAPTAEPGIKRGYRQTHLKRRGLLVKPENRPVGSRLKESLRARLMEYGEENYRLAMEISGGNEDQVRVVLKEWEKKPPPTHGLGSPKEEG